MFEEKLRNELDARNREIQELSTGIKIMNKEFKELLKFDPVQSIRTKSQEDSLLKTLVSLKLAAKEVVLNLRQKNKIAEKLHQESYESLQLDLASQEREFTQSQKELEATKLELQRTLICQKELEY